MTHLRIEQNEGVVEYVDSSVVEELYDKSKNSSNNFIGTINVPACYKEQALYLTTTYPNFHIQSQDYWVWFQDKEFETYISGIAGSGGHITETQAKQVTSWYYTFRNSFQNKEFEYVDFSSFTNMKSIYLNTNSNDIINYCKFNILNFGNIESAVNGDYIMNQSFNARIANETYAKIIIGENIKAIADYATRSLGFEEAYFPNLEYLGNGTGSAYGTANGISYHRKFIFVGDKLKALGSPFSESNQEDNGGIFVLTATTPPKWQSWNNGAKTTEGTDKTAVPSVYVLGAYTYYVPDSAIENYKTEFVWSTIATMFNGTRLKPLSELPDQYKEKISKWYTFE